MDDCEQVSRNVSAYLDVEDPISGQYTLEVSSPGIDRPLVKPEHFQRFVGERVKVKLMSHHMGRKRFTGQLVAAQDQDDDEAGIVVEVDGEPIETLQRGRGCSRCRGTGFAGRLGIFAGRHMHLGPSALLDLGGIKVVVISDRSQTADPVFFEMFGLDIAEARTVCVKSRGHFRAGFLPFFPPETVYEVDTAGLTSPVLERWPLSRIPRPSFPLDADAEFALP